MCSDIKYLNLDSLDRFIYEIFSSMYHMNKNWIISFLIHKNHHKNNFSGDFFSVLFQENDDEKKSPLKICKEIEFLSPERVSMRFV